MTKIPVVPNNLQENYTSWHFSPAIISGDFLFCAGCTGRRLDGTISPDITGQAEQSFLTIEKSLKEAGLTFDNIVEITTYHVGLQEHLSDFMTVKDKFIKEPYPAWTAIGVSELAVSGAIIEIKVIANRNS